MNSNINSMEEKKSAKHQHHHHQQQQSLTRLVTLFAIVAVIIAQSVLLVPTAEARYLPTRSNVDQLKRQEIKEILRLLLDLPESEQRESQPSAVWSSVGSGSRLADLYELSAIRGGAAGGNRHTPNAAEMAAVVSMEGAGDSARAKRDVNIHSKQANKQVKF